MSLHIHSYILFGANIFRERGRAILRHLIPTDSLNLVYSGLDFGSSSMVHKLHSLLPSLFCYVLALLKSL